MKIFSAHQIRQWDEYTMLHEPISSINLMERAAGACYNWLQNNLSFNQPFHIFCGKGNNGGDGLAIAALLLSNNNSVVIYIVETGKQGSADFEINLKRLIEMKAAIHLIHDSTDLPTIMPEDIVIDALFGTGLNKPLDGIYKAVVEKINQANACTISIDMPSGLYADESSKNNPVIRASHTLSFQIYKLAFLMPENAPFCGIVQVLDIGLHPNYKPEGSASAASINDQITDQALLKSLYQPSTAFAHKGNFGHAALLCGSMGMMGAAVLASLACMRSGAGKLTSYIPKCGYTILQTLVPEAMCIVAGEDYLLSASGVEKFDAVGIGPGLGLHPQNRMLLLTIFQKLNRPMVIDADALNTIAFHPELLLHIPANSIITPHPKEFERMFGKTQNNFERVELARQKSKELNIIIILKGHYSFICTPEGDGWFNNTGNAGMATAGSGDVLTGIITGLLARGYLPFAAAILGTYVHGLAGDLAVLKFSSEALLARDIIGELGMAFQKISDF